MNLKKTLAILIGASMLCSTSVSAQPFDNSELEYETVQTEKVNASSGTCGENLTWTLDDSGTLTISGTGDMYNYDYYFYSSPFDYDDSIITVIIENGVTSIGDCAFYECSSLTSITIPDSVTSIGYAAFEGCSSLTSITIPDSVTSIGYCAFRDCSSLTSVTIPDSVTSIGDYAFYCCSKLTSVVIPDSVTSIGDGAFSDCSSLTSVTISDSVASIGSCAFYNCSSLASVTIPDSVTSIGWDAFRDCSSLTSVTIPDSVTSIGDNAFRNCSSLTSVTIPDSVTSIGKGAFRGCSSLTSVTIPDSVTSIGDYSFAYCSSLRLILVDVNNEYYASDEYGVLFNKDKTALIQYPIGNERTSYVIPDSVTNIGDSAFGYCLSLTSVTIGDNVTSIGYSAFYGCSSLTSVTIPDSVTSIGDDAFSDTGYYNNEENWENSVLYIGNHLIAAKEDISGDYSIKQGTLTIAGGAFAFCSNFTSVVIPDSVTSIGGSAFEDCSSLTSVTIPDSVTSIGDYAFCGCSSLTSVTIPDSVTSIGYGAFWYCLSLTSITIPDSVTSIGSYAFADCSSLTDVYYTGSEEEWNEISIGFYNEELLNANITFNYRNVICEGTRETAAKDGTFELMIGGTSFGKFTFTSVDGGFTVMNEDGEYLSLSNRKLVFGDDAGIWTYNNGRLSISTGSRLFARNYYLTASRNALTVSTSTRNTDITLLEEFSLNTHTFGDYIDNGDGTHSLICEYCGFEESESCVYGDDHKCICGAVDKAYVSLEISVEVNKTTTGSFFKRTNYVATITVDALGIDVAKVQYSTNNRRWYTGTSYSSRSNITTLYVRVTDTDGNVYDYTYKA